MTTYFTKRQMKILEALAKTGEPQYINRGDVMLCEAVFKLAATGLVSMYTPTCSPRPRYRVQFPWQDIDLYDWKQLNKESSKVI